MEIGLDSVFLSNLDEKVLHTEVVTASKSSWTIGITETFLYIDTVKSIFKYDWADVLGANLIKNKKKKKICISVFPEVNSRRQRIRYQLISEDPAKLQKIIQNMAYFRKMPEVYESLYVRRFMVIINPNSGRGTAKRIWAQVEEFFEVCEVNLVYTERRNHATEIVRDLNLSDCDGLIVVSGDGLVHEVINALCNREDGDLARLFPVGVVPAGSANALAQVVCDKCGEKVTPENCAYICIKGAISPFDISQVKFSDGRIVYSFLSVFWAFIADVDIESEKCRCCGACRFDCYGFFRVLSLRRYAGKITWEGGEYSGPLVYFMACNTPFVGTGMNVAPKSKINDGMNDLLFLGDVGRMALIRVLLRQDAGTHINSPHLQYIKTSKWRLEPSGKRMGILSIDGELFQTDTIEVEVLQNYASVFLLG